MMTPPQRETALARPATLGVLGGARAFFQGFGFVVSRPSVWPYAMVPALLATVLIGVLGALGIRTATGLADRLVGMPESTWGAVGLWAVRLLLYAAALVVAVMTGSALAQPLSGPALDRIVRAQEEALGGASWPDAPFLESLGRSLRVTFFAMALGLPLVLLLTVLEFLFPPAVVVTWPAKLVIAAFIATWDLVDYPFSMRGAGVRSRVAWIRAHKGAALGFGVFVALLAFIPLVGLLVLPIGVAGATRLVASTERASGRP